VKPYDQTLEYYLRNGCTIITLLNIIKYKFGITVHLNFIMKIAVFFDKLEKWFPKSGAIFDIIYNAFVNEINKKLKLNFVLIKVSVYRLKTDDTWTYWFWTPKYCRPFSLWLEKQEFTIKDVTKIMNYTWTVSSHNMAFDWSKGWYCINTNGKTPTKMKLGILKEMATQWIIRSPVRTIIPADEYTKEVCDLTKRLAFAERVWTLKLLDLILKWNKYFPKAKSLFYYWRS